MAIYKEVQELSGWITIDPGFGSGWAYWLYSKPVESGRFMIKKSIISLPERINYMAGEFRTVIDTLAKSVPLNGVLLEGCEVRNNSFKGSVAADSGAVIKLALITGAYIHVCGQAKLQCEIVAASEWKGNLPKEVIGDRIFRINGKRYKEHEEEAVGMGYGLCGLL